jgi:hypothetical protein
MAGGSRGGVATRLPGVSVTLVRVWLRSKVEVNGDTVQWFLEESGQPICCVLETSTRQLSASSTNMYYTEISFI